jgi:hypothetical protein
MRTIVPLLLAFTACGSPIDPATHISLGDLSSQPVASTGEQLNYCIVLESGHADCSAYDPSDVHANVGPEVRNIVDLNASRNFGCLVLRDGSVKCWGANNDGELGPGLPIGTSSTTPVIVPPPVIITHVVVGARNACGLLQDGEVECWGTNSWISTQTPFGLGLDNVIDVAVSDKSFICTVDGSGRVRCFDQFGVPSLFSGINDAVQISVAPDDGDLNLSGPAALRWCAVRASGAVACWASTRALTDGFLYSIPKITDAKQVAIGSSEACVRQASGAVSCWANLTQYDDSDLGVYNRDNAPPTRVQGLGAVSDITLGPVLCGVLTDGHVDCVGANGEVFELR